MSVRPHDTAVEALDARPEPVGGGGVRAELSERLVASAAVAGGAIPLIVAAVVLHAKHWYPIGDLAQAELRVRSFWAHPPLIGAAGRIGTLAERGSHPGPAMFWALWPGYRIFGGSSWALEVSVLLLDVVFLAAIGAVVRRRGGSTLVLVVVTATAALLWRFGIVVLVQPWNPYTPLVPFALFVVLVWSVLCDDIAMLPWAVVVGSYCVQCHVGYIPLVVVLLGLGVVWAAVDGRRHHSIRLGWWIASVAAGVVMWIPPIIDQLTHDPGNLRILWRYFTHSGETPVGVLGGARIMLSQLVPVPGLLNSQDARHGPLVLGAALVVLWAVLAVLSWRRRLDPRLVRLHVVVAFGLAAGYAAATRIFGTLFLYLVEWIWVLGLFTGLATLWSVVAILRALRTGWPWRLHAGAAAVAGAVLVVTCIGFSLQAADAGVPYPGYSRTLATLVPATLAKLDRTGTYVLVSDDPFSLDGPRDGLLLALERHGVHAGVTAPYRVADEPHRVIDPAHATAVLHVVSGPDIARWRRAGAAQLLGFADVRTPAEKAQADRLNARIRAELVTAGLPDLAAEMDHNVFLVGIDPRLPASIAGDVAELIALPHPTAVFLTAPRDLAAAPPAA